MVRSTLAALLVASAFGPAAAGADAPVRVTAPVDGTVLVPGRSMTITWEPTAAWTGYGSPDNPWVGADGDTTPIEEWEAFLSVNGGRTYPYRVTPHLDADVTTFHFPVPEVVSADVRILIRMGNERREVGFEMPQRLSIAPAGPLLQLRLASNEARYVVGRRRGESARPGESGVRMWVEGDRRGRNLKTVTSSGPPTVRGRSIEAGDLRLLAFVAPRPQPSSASLDETVSRREGVVEKTDAAPTIAARAASILLLIQRSNR